jgi:hypothetical protein
MRNDAVSPETGTTGLDGTSRRPLVRVAFALACALALLPLAWLDLSRPQPLLYLSWLAAMALYVLQWPRPRGLMRWRPSRWLLATFGAYACALFVGFCFIYDNWRFAVTGDSLLFYEVGERILHGRVNALSLRGVFEQCTVIQATLQNAFMHLSESLFAHRLGNLFTSTMIVAAAALFVAQTGSATAAVLLGLFLPLNSVFLVFTLISYPNLSALLPYYAAYALFLAAWRVWTSGFLWAALGLTCGLAFYFLPLWMGAVAVVSAGVAGSAIYWRTPRIFLIWAGGVLVALVPALLQWNTLLRLYLIFRAGTGLTLDYFLKIASQTFSLPIYLAQRTYGADGTFLAFPFGYLFLAGVVLAAAGGVRALLGRPRTRALEHAWVWLFLYASDAVGLALQNSGYAHISVKRAIVLLPAMHFLMVLPLAWLAERVSRTWFTVAMTVIALVPYAYLNLTTFWWIEHGFNTGDAMVRITQEAPGRVLLVTRNEGLLRQYGPAPAGPHDPLQSMYRVRDRTVVTTLVPTHRGDFDRVVCFSRHTDGEEWGKQVREALSRLCPGKAVEMLTPQMECVTCDPR